MSVKHIYCCYPLLLSLPSCYSCHPQLSYVTCECLSICLHVAEYPRVPPAGVVPVVLVQTEPQPQLVHVVGQRQQTRREPDRVGYQLTVLGLRVGLIVG